LYKYYNNYIGAFREDTINKKVFFIPENNSYDTLLYDFNLSIGDTLLSSIINDSINYMNHVSLIDSIIVGNKYYKRYGLSSGSNLNYVYLIQGIGSTFGLFGYLYPPFESGTTLLCFKQNGQTLYPDTTTNCQLITSLNSNEEISNQVKVFPNPTTNDFTVRFSEKVTGKINIYDIKGNLVKQQKVNLTDEINLFLGSISQGTYIISFINKMNKIVASKQLIIK